MKYSHNNWYIKQGQATCEGYGVATAIVESTPDNPIGTLDRFGNRKITKANAKARELGIKEAMNVTDAFALIA